MTYGALSVGWHVTNIRPPQLVRSNAMASTETSLEKRIAEINVERSESGIIPIREKADDVGDDEMSLDISFPQFWYVEQIRSMP
jgi:hypothetical protein